MIWTNGSEWRFRGRTLGGSIVNTIQGSTGCLGSPSTLKVLGSQEVLVLVGARRTGESTIARRIIRRLQDDGVRPEDVLLMNLDEPLFKNMSGDPDLIGG